MNCHQLTKHCARGQLQAQQQHASQHNTGPQGRPDIQTCRHAVTPRRRCSCRPADTQAHAPLSTASTSNVTLLLPVQPLPLPMHRSPPCRTHATPPPSPPPPAMPCSLCRSLAPARPLLPTELALLQTQLQPRPTHTGIRVLSCLSWACNRSAPPALQRPAPARWSRVALPLTPTAHRLPSQLLTGETSTGARLRTATVAPAARLRPAPCHCHWCIAPRPGRIMDLTLQCCPAELLRQELAPAAATGLAASTITAAAAAAAAASSTAPFAANSTCRHATARPSTPPASSLARPPAAPQALDARRAENALRQLMTQSMRWRHVTGMGRRTTGGDGYTSGVLRRQVEEGSEEGRGGCQD